MQLIDKIRVGGREMGELAGEKTIIPVSKCRPGMVLLQPIVDEKTGAILLPRGGRLTEESIKKVVHFQHTQVWVELNTEEKIWQTKEHVVETYKEYATTLKYIIEGEQTPGEMLNIESLKNLAQYIIRDFKEDFELLACVNLVSELDKEYYAHSINVAFLALVMGRWREYSEEKLEKLVLAALLHDVGKVDMPIALKETEMDRRLRERLAYKRHPIYGYEKLAKYNELDNEVLKAVLTHHERCDGSGFPLSLRGDKINDLSKIISLADTYDKLRKKDHIFNVIRELRSTYVRAFDIELLLEFCTNIMNYYIGNHVLLSTGEIAEVHTVSSQSIYRPVVKVGDKMIDLYVQSQIDIVKVF